MAAPDDLLEGLHELSEARDDYRVAWDYWTGDTDEHFASAAVRRVMQRNEGRYKVNVAKTPIRVVTDRLRVAALTALTLDGAPDGAANEALQTRVLAANLAGIQIPRTIRNACVYGDAYLFVHPKTDPAGQTVAGVRVSYNSPLIARTVYDDEDEQQIAYQIKAWEARGVQHANLYYPNADGTARVEKWVLREGGAPDDPAMWVRDPDAEQDIPLAFGLPLHHFRTDLPYGVPLHRDAYGPQEGIDKLSSTMAYTSEAAGFPQRYALTEPGAALNGDGGDSPDWDDDADADLATRDDTRIRTGPGEIALLQGIKNVGQWTAANADAFIAPANWYNRMLAATGGIPMRYLDGGASLPSGESLRVADAPITAQIDTLQTVFGPSVSGFAEQALRILGFDVRVDVRWKPAGIVDDQSTWTIVEAKIRNGVPPKVALSETGLYEDSEIDTWLSDSQVEMDVARRISLLGQVASAVQGLGQGVALGLLSDQQAKAVVDATLGQLEPDLSGDVPA